MKKNIFQRIAIELTRPRSIEFCSYETEEEENERLALEQKQRIAEIKATKKAKLLQERIIPYFRDLELFQSGLLLSDEILRERAEASLALAMAEGRVDEFYNIVTKETN